MNRKDRKVKSIYLLCVFAVILHSHVLLATNQAGHVSSCLICKDYGHLLISDTKHIFTFPSYWTRRQWLTFGGFIATTAVLMSLDRQIQDAIQPRRSKVIDKAADIFTPFGSYYSYGILGGFYVGGLALHDQRTLAVAKDGIAASIIAHDFIVRPLKELIGRRRPRPGVSAFHFHPFSKDDSFPSGHTTQAFVVASVITSHYHPLWLKFVSYGVATGVALARMDNNRHFASDVVVGALIGTLTGREVVRFNAQRENPHQGNYMIFPEFDQRGASLQISFAR